MQHTYIIRLHTFYFSSSAGDVCVIQGDYYGICRAIHAEANALLNCSRQQTMGADLYLTGVNPGDNSIHEAKPCPMCARMIIQAGIRNVYLRVGEGADNYVVVAAKDLIWCRKKISIKLRYLFYEKLLKYIFNSLTLTIGRPNKMILLFYRRKFG